MLTGNLLEHPSLPGLWAGAGYAYESAGDPDHPNNTFQGVAKLVVDTFDTKRDPGVHNYDLGENVTVVTEPESSTGGTESILHLVQDEDTTAELH
eukprot:1869794-Karenia_brevis.AAC.1